MSEKLRKVLSGEGDNYILPFFWQRGEDETTLRKYMKVIQEANIGAVCVESRPHPDFCGEKWWQDMDVILEEARARNMKVWILDDSHFPTGFANGAMANQPDELCRQSICHRTCQVQPAEMIHLSAEELAHPVPFAFTELEQFIGDKNPRQFEDDQRTAVFAIRTEQWNTLSADPSAYTQAVKRGYVLDLTEFVSEGELRWTAPNEEGWTVMVLYLSRNMGYHRSYINMLDESSCRVLIDAVYEPHFAKYKDDFGTTIAGFFSDEPELGNGHLYSKETGMGDDIDFPWSRELGLELEKRLGASYMQLLGLLWLDQAPDNWKAMVRYVYMDTLTTLVKKNFSKQIGDWCRAHGVQYIGHLIEDNNQHSKTGCSLGHYFRGLAGQDMAGIDDIGGQVLPQQEDVDFDRGPFQTRNGEFYHYMLGRLASSAAAIEPGKHGDSMCEIFGAYGWSEGVNLEKYLVDHFLVRGINHYVPHAFSAKEFPDPDCPPHFYAQGNNPQYRHFGSLMAYTNRACELISGGLHVTNAAIVYHGEGDWTGAKEYSQKAAHILSDSQIDHDIIPADVFAFPEEYQTVFERGELVVNRQRYQAVIIPYMQFVTTALVEGIRKLTASHIPVWFTTDRPQGICNQSDPDQLQKDQDIISQVPVIALKDLVKELRSRHIPELTILPQNDRIRTFHYEHTDGSAVILFVNEGTKAYQGTVGLEDDREKYYYDAWNQKRYPVIQSAQGLKLYLEPLHSIFLILDTEALQASELEQPLWERFAEAKETGFLNNWQRSICRCIDYPNFEKGKVVTIPDDLATQEPEFSGFVRYENSFAAEAGCEMMLEITDAAEGVEVFLNRTSLGIQVAPPFRYELTQFLVSGENQLVIEVATTLERELAKIPDMLGRTAEAESQSGITGPIALYYR